MKRPPPSSTMLNTALNYAGADEAGRGCLCGNVVTAAVILPPDWRPCGLTDSKKLTAHKREQLAQQIRENALSWSVVAISPEQIDRMNILRASLYGMQRAVEKLTLQPDIIYVDGNYRLDTTIPSVAVIKGDYWIKSISAASILAKVERDRQMRALDQQYPEYGFAAHKGYPTKKHLAQLSQLPVLDCYRKSYKPVKSILQQRGHI